jgi:hypothetical protein
VGVWKPSHSLVKNKTFHHLGETGNELKLTDLHEKSGGLKGSIIPSRLAWPEQGLETAYISAPYRTTLENSPTPESPSYQEKPELKKL